MTADQPTPSRISWPWCGDVPSGSERRGEVTATIQADDGRVTLAWEPDTANCTIVGRELLTALVDERNQLTDQLERVREELASWQKAHGERGDLLDDVRKLANALDVEAQRVDEYRGDGATETDNRIIDQAVRIHRQHAAELRKALTGHSPLTGQVAALNCPGSWVTDTEAETQRTEAEQMRSLLAELAPLVRCVDDPEHRLGIPPRPTLGLGCGECLAPPNKEASASRER